MQAVEKAYQWLISQQVPNKTVPYPVMNRRHFILSFELSPDNPQNNNDRSYQYIFSRSSLYDNALSIIAFTMLHDFKRASQIIEALYRNVEEDGLLWFTYNTHNGWPDKEDSSWAISRNGASAWAGYAIVFYIQAVLLSKKLKQNTELKDYLQLAKDIADYILKWQVLDSNDPRFGFVIGGVNKLELIYDPEKKTVVEKFIEGPTEWVSVEHNIDMYFFLRDLGKLSQDKKYTMASEIMKKNLMARAWDQKTTQFVRGMRKGGPDRFLALDCASWGAIFLDTIGESEKAQKALKATNKYLILDASKKSSGHKPYLSGLVYEEQPEVNSFYFPQNPEQTWKEMKMIWPEGSLGVAMAALKLGKLELAQKIQKWMRNYQEKSGGFIYANQDLPFQFSTSPSVAGTAWYIMVSKSMEEPQWKGLFWGKD